MKKRMISMAAILIMFMLLILPTTAEVNAAEAWMQQEAQLDHVTDAAGLLTDEEWQDLELQARALAETYGFGVYIITVDDYQDYTDGDTHDASTELYKGYSLGIGEGKDGLLLLLSMADRDLNLYTYGDYGHYAFGDAAREQMLPFYLDDFGEDEWYDGFSDYLEWAGKYLEQAEAGTPYSEDHPAMSAKDKASAILIRIGIIILVPLIIAGIVLLVMLSMMKSVADATEASAYVAGGLDLSGKTDIFSHQTEVRRKIEKEKSEGSSRSSGGGSSTSSKF